MDALESRPLTPLLDVRGIQKTFSSRSLFGPTRRVVAAQDVSFRVERGEAVALVGESGSGKSTIARLILRLEGPDAGEIRLDGVDVLETEPKKASLGFRGRIQMVFQDPFASLNPVHDIEHHLVTPLRLHQRDEGRQSALNPVHDVEHHLARPLSRQGRKVSIRERAAELLRTVGLEPAEEFLDRHPYELSGGQRQRVAIARALAVDPDLLVADEPTSMLDVSIRMDILKLLTRLKEERRLAILLITHDLASARYLADRVLVLFRGRVVEDGPSRDVVEDPAHPYTRALLDSIADTGTRRARSTEPSPESRPGEGAGCPFASRCVDVMDVCRTTDPAPRNVGGRRVRCHLHEEGAPAPGSGTDG